MDRKHIFRLAWALTLLVSFSLGCKLVSEAQDMIALATDIDLEGLATDIDVDALATEIDIENLATEIDIEGLVTEIDVNEMATEMESMATDLGSFLTDMPDLSGTLVAAGTPSGFPDDIPVMEGEKLNMSGTPTSLEYTLDVDYKAVVDFYQREMAARGWTDAGSNLQDGEANLVFQKGARRATVNIAEDFLFGVAVKITVEG